MRETKTVEAIVITISALFIIGCLSGCTSNQNTTPNHLVGIWAGSVEMPMGGGRGNTSISQLSFTDTSVQLTMESKMGTWTMEYTYSINGNTLVLQPSFSGGGPFPRGPSQNGTQPWNNNTRPPGNWSGPSNGTGPYNGSWPSNWTQPNNGTRQPGNGRPSMSITFEYYTNEDYTIISLNGAQFTKIQ
jgi:hypothetical protein